MDEAYVHPRALCESERVGPGTRIWAFAHVMSGAEVGAGCNVGEGVFVEGGARVGDRVTIKNSVLIWEGVELADDVFVGPGVLFTNDRYPRSPRMEQAAARYADKGWLERTHVGRGASLGAGAIVLPGVRIGAYATVAAGALVSRDVAPYQLVAGRPAQARGWVCACGLRLGDDLRCGGCGAGYRLASAGLEPEGEHV